jgi:hypothetical protein
MVDTQACSEGGECPVDCVVGEWSVWNAVAYSGTKTSKIVRTRSVTIHQQHGGKDCPKLIEYRNFKGGANCKDGKEVGPWSTCDATTQTQHRMKTDIRCPKTAVVKLQLKIKQMRPCKADSYNKVKFGGDYSAPGADESTFKPYEFDNLGEAMRKQQQNAV